MKNIKENINCPDARSGNALIGVMTYMLSGHFNFIGGLNHEKKRIFVIEN